VAKTSKKLKYDEGLFSCMVDAETVAVLLTTIGIPIAVSAFMIRKNNKSTSDAILASISVTAAFIGISTSLRNREVSEFQHNVLIDQQRF